jgi:formylglycine-generating enzyme
MKRELVRRLRGAAPTLLLAAGCAKILGFDESTAVPCVSSSDCAVGFVCLRETCQCDGECPAGGTAGQGGSQAGGQGGSQIGGEAGASSPNAGKGSTAGGAGGTGGIGGTGTGGSAGEGGDSGSAGAGNAPTVGGASGSAGEPVGGDGGSAGGVPTSECGDEAQSCLVCDEAGKHLPGETPCEVACQGSGECVWPPSCDGLGSICAGEDCCISLPVHGGGFARTCDSSCSALCVDMDAEPYFPATISSFALDVFEVTVGRFRRFVDVYAKPKPGAGRNPRNSTDTGWDPEWDASLPADRTALREALQDPALCVGPVLWTAFDPSQDDVPNHEVHPMNCVTWFEAQAFCIWDGGRLPTEAEWNFVAGGGDEERTYPWSQPPAATDIDDSRAIFQFDLDPPAEPLPVGSRLGGRGRWGHLDLGGNVAEWVWDGFRDCYSSPLICADCGNPPGSGARIVRGGGFHNSAESVSVQTRREAEGLMRHAGFGFRCLRDL